MPTRPARDTRAAAAPARLADVAAASGVSIKTASRVINNEAGVLPATRQRVDDAVLRLGYVPNGLARSLKTGTHEAIGMLIDAISDPFFASMVSEIEELALEQGMSVLFASTGIDTEREREQLRRLAGHGLRGIIAAPVSIEGDELRLLRRRMPIVCVDRAVEGLDSVCVDDFGATASVIAQFAEAGHTRIAFVGREDHQPHTVGRRLDGYLSALQGAGLKYEPELVLDTGSTRAETAAAVRSLLNGPHAPTAVFCSSARAAKAALDVVGGGGYEQIAFASFGDLELATAFTPALSCIAHNPRVTALHAFNRIMELLDSADAPAQRLVLPLEYIPRGSGELPPSTPGDAAGSSALLANTPETRSR